MRTALSLLLLLLLLASSAQAQGEHESALRQIAGILDYIGADYAGAVDDSGQVTNELEYREQFSLTDDALAMTRNARLADDDPVVVGLRALRETLASKPPPAQVLEQCRAVRQALVDGSDVSLTPDRAPDLAHGRSLYTTNACQTCHGVDGSANTPQAAQLTPRPANFLDADRVSGVSPYRAFYAITFGVRDTGMQGFPQLTDGERWDLAFYVLSLRHASRDLARGERAVAAHPIDVTPASLSQKTEADLIAALGDIPDARDALAYLRAKAPFREREAPDGTLTLSRARLREGLAAYRAGDRALARQKFIEAYLDGFEPKEAALAARDRTLVLQIETEMLGLREDTARGVPIVQLEDRVEHVRTLFDRAEGTAMSGSTAFLGALAISLREGFEAVLLVTALLALVRKRGAGKHVRLVHAGWLAAIPAGLLTWLAAGKVLGGLERELAEGIVALLAAVVLLGVTHWIVGQATAKQWMGFLAKRVGNAAGGKGASLMAAFAVFALAFIAVYREAFEIVLFFQALLLDAAGHQALVWLGALAGIAVLAALSFGLKLIGQKLAPKPFMLASSVVLALLALVLVGKGVRALQEAGVCPLTSLPLPELSMIGLYPTLQGLVAQGVLLALLLASAIQPWRASRRDAKGPAPAPAE